MNSGLSLKGFNKLAQGKAKYAERLSVALGFQCRLQRRPARAKQKHSIPNIAFVEFKFMTIKKNSQLVLETQFLMMFGLVHDVSLNFIPI
jgi:hypothetical protein